MNLHWCSGDGRIDLYMTLEQARSASHPGSCDAEVKILVEELADQLADIQDCDLRRVLGEYGAWDEVELSVRADNLQRLVWVAAGDIADDPGGRE